MDSNESTSFDVIAWPTNGETRAVLEQYVDGLKDGDTTKTLAAPQFDFRGADLSGLYLAGAYLLGADLSGVKMAGCDLSRATLSGANLRGADLSQAKMIKAEAVEVEADSAVLRGVHGFSVNFAMAELRNTDIRDAILNSSRFSRADLSYADIRASSLRYCRFGGRQRPTRLIRARLAGCPLDDASGCVIGPIDISDDAVVNHLDGAEAARWLAAHGAPNVEVVPDVAG